MLLVSERVSSQRPRAQSECRCGRLPRSFDSPECRRSHNSVSPWRLPVMTTPSTPSRKRALITGAGGGLGREVALQLAGRGCAVAILDIDRAGAESTSLRCGELGGEALAIVDDLTRAQCPEEAVATVSR